jgi:hypothetical protein
MQNKISRNHAAGGRFLARWSHVASIWTCVALITLKSDKNLIVISDLEHFVLKTGNDCTGIFLYLSSINHRLSAESLSYIILIINSIIVSSRTEKGKAITSVFISEKREHRKIIILSSASFPVSHALSLPAQSVVHFA